MVTGQVWGNTNRLAWEINSFKAYDDMRAIEEGTL